MYIFFIGNCTGCPDGWYSDVRGQTECKQCQLGEDFVGPKQSCSACDIGTFGAVEGECADCSNGLYQDARGQTECKQCKLGEGFVDPKQLCSACDTGTFGAVKGKCIFF